MAIETTCSGCGQTLAVADENAGKRARCPACQQIYTVPFQTVPFQTAPFQTAPVKPAGPTESSFGVGGNPYGDAHPALAETVASGQPSDGAHSKEVPDASAPAVSYWMRASDGNEYGPVDRAKLNRWFQEGRVGSGYMIRQHSEQSSDALAAAGASECNEWLPADQFRPQAAFAAGVGQAAGSANPYADQNAYRPPATVPDVRRYMKPDPSGLVLTMGILAWVCVILCWPISWIPGLVAWISGRSALKDIQAGIADPTNLSMVQVGYYLGMIQVILAMLGVVAIVGFIGLAVIMEGM